MPLVHEEITDVSDLIAVGEKILNRLSLKALLITRDGRGDVSVSTEFRQHRKSRALTPPFTHRDRCYRGRGHGCCRFPQLALAAGAEFRSAAVLSNLAGGIAVGKMGCATVTPKELLHEIKK